MLTAVSTEGAGTLTTVGLANGTNAIALTNSNDFAEYAAPRNNQTSFTNYRNLVNTASKIAKM